MKDDEIRKEKLKGVSFKADQIDKSTITAQSGERIERGFGMCDFCENFEVVENEFGSKTFNCDYHSEYFRTKAIMAAGKITSCTHYWHCGYKKIKELIGMAWLIDAGPEKQIGFIKG